MAANAQDEPGRSLRVLFAAPNCLLDPSSGASQTCRTLLERLAARGHKAVALGCTVFDRPVYRTAEIFLEQSGAQKAKLGQRDVWNVRRAGLRHILLPVAAQTRLEMTARDEGVYYRTLRMFAESSPPDVVLTYGGEVGDFAGRRMLRDLGVPVVFYLANPNYFSTEPFRDVSAILTDSIATAELYRKRLGLDPKPIGKFVQAFPPTPEDRRDFCTFLNPTPAKGAAFFIALARECLRRGIDAKFLVIEARARLAPMLKHFGLTPEDLPNVACWPLQQDMAAVWARTRVLIHPSFWHESGSRSILEALSAHVPTLATRTGGVPQMLGDSGFLFPNPIQATDADRKAYLAPVPPEAVAPWADRLQTLLEDDALYAAERARARVAWETHQHRDDIEAVERILLDLAKPSA